MAPAPPDTAPPDTGRRHLRRHRGTLLIGLGLIVAVALTLLLGVEAQQGGALDPSNADPEGARAVARVLDDQGVDVVVVRSADALEETAADADTTVVVTSTSSLGASTARRLLDHTADARLVLVDPGAGLSSTLDLPPSTYLDDDGPIPARCDDPRYDGLELAVDSAEAYAGSDGCFGTEQGPVLTEVRPGLTLLGAGEALSNDQVLRADNAAVALRLLGESERLVWYVPAVEDLVADDGVTVGTLLPDWLTPALWLTAVAGLALLVWRSRRLGALAVEPLPVTVKAIETTRSRGRLYRRSGDRAHAAEVLRGAARARAAERLRLGRHPDPDALVRDLARHTGWPLAEVAALLGPQAPAPATDQDLITLADRLAELDREVRRP